MIRLLVLVCVFILLAGAGIPASARAAEVPSMLIRLVQQVDVPAREAGLLAAVQVTEGQMVEEGELLAQIDDTEARLAEEQAVLEVQIARANATNDVNLRFARKSVDVAQAELQRAEQSNQSFAKSVSDSEMDRLRLVVERSVLAVEQSQHEQTIAGLTLQARESLVRSAQEKVQRHKLVAPFSGIVVQIKRNHGEWVTPGEAVVRILRIDRLRAEGYLPARTPGRICRAGKCG
jgi:multidrug efflux pump subunit AcrA (membrane-fusion protein)